MAAGRIAALEEENRVLTERTQVLHEQNTRQAAKLAVVADQEQRVTALVEENARLAAALERERGRTMILAEEVQRLRETVARREREDNPLAKLYRDPLVR